MVRRLPLALFAVVLVSAWSATPASAVEYTFECITFNGANCGTIGSQFVVNVDPTSDPTQVLFTFTNNGPLESSIADVYFDDGTLLGIAEVQDGSGTNFEQFANPGNLPGANNINPDFETTAGFSADSEAPIIENGANVGESFAILFNLLPGLDFNDTIDAINAGIACTEAETDCTGTLRIGLHVQGIAPQGQSEGLILTGPPDLPDPPEVPEPATLMLLGTGLGMIGAKVRNRNKKQQTTSIQ